MVKNDESTQLTDYQVAEMLVELMRKIWEKSKALTENMNSLTGLLVGKTELYMISYKPNHKATEKNKNAYITLIESIDRYSNQITQYHELLHGDECAYQVSLVFYKRLRHELVTQVILDRRRIARLIDQMPMATTSDFLLKRWHSELIRFVNLDFEPVSVLL